MMQPDRIYNKSGTMESYSPEKINVTAFTIHPRQGSIISNDIKWCVRDDRKLYSSKAKERHGNASMVRLGWL